MSTENQTPSSTPQAQPPTPAFVETVLAHLQTSYPDSVAWVAYHMGYGGKPDENGTPPDPAAVREFYRNLRRYEHDLARLGVHWVNVRDTLIITDGEYPDCFTVELIELLRENGGSWTGAPHELAIELLDYDGDYTPEEIGRALKDESKLLRAFGVNVRRKKVQGRRLIEIRGPAKLDEPEPEPDTRSPVVLEMSTPPRQGT